MAVATRLEITPLTNSGSNSKLNFIVFLTAFSRNQVLVGCLASASELHVTGLDQTSHYEVTHAKEPSDSLE